jgi:hypothetical protein
MSPSVMVLFVLSASSSYVDTSSSAINRLALERLDWYALYQPRIREYLTEAVKEIPRLYRFWCYVAIGYGFVCPLCKFKLRRHLLVVNIHRH